MTDPRWLLLGHQLPTSSSNARVKVWRRLQQVGAVAARNSVYVLPNTEQCREDFEWIRSEIVALGGEATVFAADAISEGGTADVVSVFQRTRERDYHALKTDTDRLLPRGGAKRRAPSSKPGTAMRALRALRERFNAIERIDFFNTPARRDAAASLAALEQLIHRPPAVQTFAQNALGPIEFHARRWVTRRRPGVDRMASAWLIRRFIDPDAMFAFLDRPGRTDVPFDMYTGEFSHHGELCTFEVLAERFRLQSRSIAKIGEIVHDLDMKDTKYQAPEAAAIGRMVDGLRALHTNDATLLEQGIGMFDALARSFQADDAAVPPPTATQTRRRARPPSKARRTRNKTANRNAP